MALATKIDAIGTLLAGVAPMQVGVAEVARNDRRARYIWVRLGVGPSNRKSNGGSMQEDAYTNQVRCEANSEADCEAMRVGLVQAVRSVSKGRNYLIGNAQWDEPDDASNDRFVLVVPVTLLVQVPFQSLGTATTPASAVTPNVPGEVTVEDVEIDPSGAAAGDAELQGGEG